MVSQDSNADVAMALVAGAGAATAIGGSVVFFPSLVRFASRKTLAGSLGFSAGVMIYVSFVEILGESKVSFQDAGFSEDQSKLYMTLCFFAGVAAMLALNQLVTYTLGAHHHHHHHHQHNQNIMHNTHAATTTNSYVEDDPDDQQFQATENNDDPPSPASDEIVSVACPRHDDNPTRTLDRLQQMAQSMAEHPDRSHPQSVSKQGQDRNEEIVDTHRAVSSMELEFSSDEPGCIVTTHEKDSDASRNVVPGEVDRGNIDEESVERNISKGSPKSNRKLMAMSLTTALAIGLHNFPEGLATFVAASNEPKVGAVLAVAIALHNIPEGLSVAMPVYYATGNKWKAFSWACLSGYAEPFAGFLGWLVLANSFSDTLYAISFGLVTGMMVIISVHELLPTAHQYDREDSVVTYCFIIGMAVMALSLMLFLI